MEEREFLVLADAELARLEAALEKLQEVSEADWDFELKPGGIIEIGFADDSKIIINRHAAAREIWVAARSGGFHFKLPANSGGRWLDSRSGRDLAEVLGLCLSEQGGVALLLDW
ncbi:MAG: iron donor protein CyaY [Burkholderiales bacterium]|nr:iron donor protein CyaY [Burkholderiales bacterium]